MSLAEAPAPPTEAALEAGGHAKGVAVAVVKENKDSSGLGRVKVSYPWHSQPHQSYWARVVTPMAGKDRGIYFIPEVEDEVLVAFERGESLDYRQLLLCLGSAARRLNVPGVGLEGVHYLRTIDDVTAIRAHCRPGARLIVVGGGYIGLEIAATCLKLGLDVTVLEMLERVMNRVVAPEVSAYFEAEHRAQGVKLHCNTGVAAFEGDSRVREVVCVDGRRFPAEVVVIGAGIVPVTQLAADAGITCDNGVVVDEYCRTTAADVYAAGDCTNHPSPRYGRRVRLESVDNAFEQARSAAANMLGKNSVHDKIPWFWSDQYDLKLLIVGLSHGYDRCVLRGDPATRSFSACYLRGNELLALDAINSPKDYMAARKLIAERAVLDPERLADPAVALKDCS